ncbi:MAG: hypothetical protein JW384_00681 [Nitrosomonadaceae bacterium]|nr:hypothetical protein [Nitrosomonadaceae bacterium]
MGIHLRVTALLAMMAPSTAGWDQSPLPPCPADQSYRWHNCFGSGPGAESSEYVGEWRDNKNYGEGTFAYTDGRKYVGEFSDSKHHGQGTYTYADGRKYIGEYRDDKRNGQGTLYTRDGVVLMNGVWQRGEFVAANNLPLSVPKFP